MARGGGSCLLRAYSRFRDLSGPSRPVRLLICWRAELSWVWLLCSHRSHRASRASPGAIYFTDSASRHWQRNEGDTWLERTDGPGASFPPATSPVPLILFLLRLRLCLASIYVSPCPPVYSLKAPTVAHSLHILTAHPAAHPAARSAARCHDSVFSTYNAGVQKSEGQYGTRKRNPLPAPSLFHLSIYLALG